MRNSNRTALAALYVFSLAFGVNGAGAQSTAGGELSYQELLQILKTAKPAPNPLPPSAFSKAPTNPGRAIEFDPATGEVKILPLPPTSRKQGSKDSQNLGPGFPPRADGRPPHFSGETTTEESYDGAQKITPTKPSPITAVTTFPWQSVFKMLMRFRVGTVDFFYVCSASARGSFHILTAGHCIYNWDPNDDDNTSDRRWADEVWVWAAQTDRVAPIGTLDFPYGVAKGTYLRSFTGWTNDQNLNYDYGLVTLDRRQGDHTGWMGANNSVAGSLNFDGYPSETPYVPAGEYRQYPGFDSGNVASSTSTRINLDAYTYGGHSGGPAWQFTSSSGERNVQGINSTSNRVGSAGETRVTSDIISNFQAARTTDESARPPTARPNLIEYVFSTTAKDLLTNAADQGDPISVEYNVFNAGFATASTVNVDFYLSTNNIISTGDSYIGTRSLGSLGAFTYSNPTTSLTVPLSQPVGFYYVGWIMRTASTEYESSDNTVVISTEQVQVRQRLLPPATVTSLITPKGAIATRRPTFKWGAPARATSYTLVIRKAGSQVFRGVYTAGTLGCSGGGTCQIKLSEADRLGFGKHQWRVKARNAAGNAPFSDFVNFKVENNSAGATAALD